MTVQIAPSPANPGGWVSLFPITAAWAAAWQEAGELWLGVMGAAGQAAVEAVRAQAEFVSRAVALGLETAGGAAVVGEMVEACGVTAVCGTEQLAEAALHVVEDLGPAAPDFVRLPE